MPTLNWIGKDKVVTHHQDVPFRVLNRQYTFGDTPDSGNMIIHGDNLEALKALLPKYEGKIKCIYIDPPYNTGNEGWVYNDNVNDPRIKAWLGQVVGKELDDLTRHDKWLCMMYPRLVLLQRLLSNDGAIFISIDDNEIANLRLICDEIFGAANYVNCICVNMNSLSGLKMTHAIRGKRYPAQKEYILLYKKGLGETTFSIEKLHKEKWDKEYNLIIPELNPDDFDNFQKIEIEEVNTVLSKCHLQSLAAYIKENGISGDENWKWQNAYRIFGSKSNVSLAQKIESKVFNQQIWAYHNTEGNTRFFRTDYTKGTKDPRIELVQAESNSSVFLSDNWIDVSTDGGIAQEGGVIFPNGKKPLKLIERIVRSICREGDIVLDCFAGSGTTAHAVLDEAQKQDIKLNFILVEFGDYIEEKTARRIKNVILGNKSTLGTGGSFDFYELGETIFDNSTGLLNDKADVEQIRQYVWYTETKSAYIDDPNKSNKYLLGTHNFADYYFYYEPEEETVLDWEFLQDIKQRAEQYIIFADRCLLAEEEMQKHNIVFKKIPRDIKRQ